MKHGFAVMDATLHVVEPPDLWERYTATPFCDRAPKLRRVREMIRTAHDRWGRLDILVNNAGVMLLGQIDGADTEDWRRMVNTNVLGLMYATHAALPLMKAQNVGHVVNISSVAGRTAA